MVCANCSKGNLDFLEPTFCPIQTAYGVYGEHPAIKYDTEDFMVKCDESDEELVY